MGAEFLRRSRQGLSLQYLLIGLSLVLALLRGSVLSGSVVALVLVVVLQVYLPGYLLARVMGKTAAHLHPIVRFAWVLGCGLGLTICLGAVARLLDVRLEIYLVVLHAIMVGLVAIKGQTRSTAPRWVLKRQMIPLYIAVSVCCVIAMGVNYASRYRFYGFEDQAIFISLADWIVHNPDDPMLRSRQVGVINGDTRFDTDGWTYNHAAWVYSSGVPAAQLIWYDLNALMVWTVPLVVFAMAYEITQREEAAAWSAVGLTLASLFTLDNIVYGPAYYAFGRFALFQINTLRQASLSFMLPLTLLAGFSYLRTWQRRDLLLILVFGLALATMHPFPIMIFLLSMGVTAGLQWLMTTNKEKAGHLVKLGLLVVVLAGILILPLVQRLNRPNIAASNFVDEDAPTTSSNFLILPNVPLVGNTYILKPDAFFYHPVIVVATVLGLLHVIGIGRSLAAQYIFGSTALVLILVFTPGLTEFFNRFASSVGVYLSIFMLPVALVLGVSIDYVVRRLVRQTAAAVAAVTVMLVLVLEPFPIPASARDQLRTFNQMQGSRRVLPFQTTVIERLKNLVTESSSPLQNTVLTVPPDLTNLVVEDIPRTLITGGRISRNTARPGDDRIYNRSDLAAPWLDSADLNYLREWGVDLIVLEADSTRLPQLLLQPERFELIERPADTGYFVFRVLEGSETNALDELFAQMNAVYGGLVSPRWTPSGFELPRPADVEAWREIDEAWAALEDTSDLAVYGRAFTYTMMGDDAQALPLWEQLRATHPDIFLLQSATAHTRRMIESTPDAIAPLMNIVDNVLAVRDLLDPFFLYLITDEQLDRMIAAVENEPVVWYQLADFDQPDAVRERVALLMSRGRYDTAAAWSERGLTEVEVSPQDLVLRAAVALARGDVDGAQSILQPAMDVDAIAANRRVHRDRWSDQALNMLRNFATQQGALYVVDPTVTQDDRTASLQISAAFGNPHTRPYPVQMWRVQVISPDGGIQYAETEKDAAFVDAALSPETFEITLPADLPELTPARVIIEPRYDDTVTFPPAVVDVVLNRPESVEIPADATQAELQFGDTIQLRGYSARYRENELGVTVYWEADSHLAENYQVFVHVIDANGEVIAQQDAAPVDNRYPTSQWRTNAVIEDRHMITFDEALPAGDYTVRVGMYPLSNPATRLRVTPADERVANDSVAVYRFTVE